MANEISVTLIKQEMFRGKGPNRIRETYRMNIGAGAHYVPLQGFSDAADALPRMTQQVSPISAMMQGGNIKNATVRIVEPRVKDETDVGFTRGAFVNQNVILDVDSFDIGLLASTKALGIRAYGVVVLDTGLKEVAQTTTLTQGTLYFEVEYTPHSGGEA